MTDRLYYDIEAERLYTSSELEALGQMDLDTDGALIEVKPVQTIRQGKRIICTVWNIKTDLY